MPAIGKTQQWPQAWKRSVFILIPKKGNAKERSNYHTTALISHPNSNAQNSPSQASTVGELPDVQAGLKKGRKTRDQIANIGWIILNVRQFRKMSISALLTTAKPLTVWITINWKILKEREIPGHLTCLLRNLYAGQEATVRTGHGTIGWFQVGKDYVKAAYCQPAYLTYMQSTS